MGKKELEEHDKDLFQLSQQKKGKDIDIYETIKQIILK